MSVLSSGRRKAGLDLREAAVKAWVALLFTLYVVVRVSLRLLIGKERRDSAFAFIGFYFSRGYSVKYGSLWAKYEPHVSRVVDAVMRRGGKVLIDVGAYRGYFTMRAYKKLRVKSGAKIIAVEPDPINFAALIKTSPSDGVITLVKRAVYVVDDADETYYIGAKSRASGSIKPTAWHLRDGYLSGETIPVKTVRLDTLINRFNLERGVWSRWTSRARNILY